MPSRFARASVFEGTGRRSVQATSSGRPWTLRMGRIFGVELHVHATLALFMTWIAVAEVVAGRGWERAAVGLVFAVAVFTTVVLH